MKRFSQIICTILVFAMVFSTTAFAAETVDSRASNYFMASSVYFWHASGSQYQIWFDVTAKSGMAELGTSKITVERSADLVNWSPIKTYYKSSYPQMTTTSGTGCYVNYVTYNATTGYAYRAVVELYARNSTGSAYMTEVTDVLDLR